MHYENKPPLSRNTYSHSSLQESRGNVREGYGTDDPFREILN
jgi:hypothetical protein